MGNRAVITTEEKKIGVYLHWNGGMDSIRGFLCYCKAHGYRSPEDDCYGWARLCQVIGNFFGGTCSVGIDLYERCDTNNYDNGTYIIKDWKVIGREYYDGEEQDEYDLLKFLRSLNENMPEHDRIPDEELVDAAEEYDN